MIGLLTGTRMWLVAAHTDMRNGVDGLAAVVEAALAANPFDSHEFGFLGANNGRGGLSRRVRHDIP